MSDSEQDCFRPFFLPSALTWVERVITELVRDMSKTDSE